MPIRGDGYYLMGAVFSKVEKVKESGKYYERVTGVLGELAPIGISHGCTASKLSIPIPSSPEIRIRMGFQGPTLHMVVYLHTYGLYESNAGYSELIKCNFYDTWMNDVDIEDLIKVASSGDNVTPSGYGSEFTRDGLSVMSSNLPGGFTALPQIMPGTYWYVRKKEITREAGWMDKFRLELDLERSWQWSTSGRQRPAYDVDEMNCFKDGAIGYSRITTEYAVS